MWETQIPGARMGSRCHPAGETVVQVLAGFLTSPTCCPVAHPWAAAYSQQWTPEPGASLLAPPPMFPSMWVPGRTASPPGRVPPGSGWEDKMGSGIREGGLSALLLAQGQR